MSEEVKLRIYCGSCGEFLPFDAEKYEAHVIQKHPTRRNYATCWLNATVMRFRVDKPEGIGRLKEIEEYEAKKREEAVKCVIDAMKRLKDASKN